MTDLAELRKRLREKDDTIRALRAALAQAQTAVQVRVAGSDLPAEWTHARGEVLALSAEIVEQIQSLAGVATAWPAIDTPPAFDRVQGLRHAARVLIQAAAAVRASADDLVREVLPLAVEHLPGDLQLKEQASPLPLTLIHDLAHHHEIYRQKQATAEELRRLAREAQGKIVRAPGRPRKSSQPHPAKRGRPRRRRSV